VVADKSVLSVWEEVARKSLNSAVVAAPLICHSCISARLEKTIMRKLLTSKEKTGIADEELYPCININQATGSEVR
jgi:hypothetical protein